MSKFKALALAAFIAATGVAGIAAPSHAADYRDFGILNRNNEVPIVGVWMAHAGGTDAWKPVSLSSAIAPGERRNFNFSGPAGDNDFDFKVRYSDGYVETFSNVDLSRIGTLDAD